METKADRPEPTVAQLRRGAQGISYRADQLGASVLLWTRFAKPPDSEPVRDLINNCRVEAALIHARALATFLQAKPPKPGTKDLHHSHYKPWSGKVSRVTGRIFGAVSAHVAHPSLGSKGEEPHPGSWPLRELGMVLLGGLANFVYDPAPVTKTFDSAWFTPSPVTGYLAFADADYLLRETEVSEHPVVGRLTTELQGYLRELGRGVIPTPEG